MNTTQPFKGVYLSHNKTKMIITQELKIQTSNRNQFNNNNP